VAGDAARYLDINPKNISRRYDIIRGGVDILRKLHTDRDERGDDVMYRYGRVVLVGHSLGSVIAYDILKFYWQEVNGKMKVDPEKFAAVESFEGGNGVAPAPGLPPHRDAARFREDQYAAWLYLNREKPAGVAMPYKKDRDSPHDARWLISDLVTLGCPLTYAPLLMANGAEDVTNKIALRELPTCPPDRSKNLNPGRFTVKLSAELERLGEDVDILPQSAHLRRFAGPTSIFTTIPLVGRCPTISGAGSMTGRCMAPRCVPSPRTSATGTSSSLKTRRVAWSTWRRSSRTASSPPGTVHFISDDPRIPPPCAARRHPAVCRRA
jgi:pimeloyl-ACP methyl ester carboxylesterase